MKIEPKEIIKLREYFDTNGVCYEVVRWENNRYNLHVDLEYVKLSFLTSKNSYGGNQGLIEFYNLRDEPTGYLTAEGAIRIYEEEMADMTLKILENTGEYFELKEVAE